MYDLLKQWQEYASSLEERIDYIQEQSEGAEAQYRRQLDELHDEVVRLEKENMLNAGPCKVCGAGAFEKARLDAERAAKEAHGRLEATRRKAATVAYEEARLAVAAADAAEEAERVARVALEAQRYAQRPEEELVSLSGLARQARTNAVRATATADAINLGRLATPAGTAVADGYGIKAQEDAGMPPSPISSSKRKGKSPSTPAGKPAVKSTSKAAVAEERLDVVRCGLFWRSKESTAPPSMYALDGCKSSSMIAKRMEEHRQRGHKVSIGHGAGVHEKIGELSAAQHRWTVNVALLKGEDLNGADESGYSDPYCTLHIWCPSDAVCKHEWRSATIDQTLSPVWDKRDWKPAPLTSENALLHLVCCDWDRFGKDDFLGESLVDLSRYADGKPHQLTLVLDSYDPAADDEPVSGTIEIEVTLSQRHEG